jgi:hypothetical protein
VLRRCHGPADPARLATIVERPRARRGQRGRIDDDRLPRRGRRERDTAAVGQNEHRIAVPVGDRRRRDAMGARDPRTQQLAQRRGELGERPRVQRQRQAPERPLDRPEQPGVGQHQGDLPGLDTELLGDDLEQPRGRTLAELVDR